MKIPYLQSKNSFEDQQQGEKTVLLIRRHWFVPFSVFLIFLFFAILPFLTYYLLLRFKFLLEFYSCFWFFVVIYFLFWWVALFKKVMSYILTCILLTNKRLIRIRTKKFFKYEREEIPIENIQEISIKISGIFGSFFNFGDLEVQSAGAIAKFNLTRLPYPQRIKEKILEMKRKQGRL